MLSRNYEPSAKLAPFIGHFYVFQAPLPDDHVIDDFVLAETALVRCLIKGDWSGSDAPEELSKPGYPLFTGANFNPYKARLTGSLDMVGFALRPSGWRALFEQPHADFVDELISFEKVWGDLATKLFNDVSAASTDEEKIAIAEHIVSARLEQIGTFHIDDAMAEFEVIAREDSTIRVEEAAKHIGLSVRQLERRCKYSFGLTPKAVLRRSRFLDMAAAIRGMSSPSEEALAQLRYFDESHLNREFRRFSKMTPGQFKDANTPLQAAGLKFREQIKQGHRASQTS